jgi:hypothetical protein
MKMIRSSILLALLLATGCLPACVYPFEVGGVAEISPMLVVEGDIIVNGTTLVRLTRSTSLQESNPMIECDAQVFIEGEQGGRYPVLETAPGQYEAETSQLDPRQCYRLHLTLADQKQYVSAYVPVVVTPAIDSVGYSFHSDTTAMAIHVSTHDAEGHARYYKWTYEETWEITPSLLSSVLFDSEAKEYRFREAEESLHYCWTSRKSSGILLGNTTRLAADVIDKQVLLTIPERDMRAENLYCIQLTQMALTQGAYIYWENIRKNSEDVGGLFSPQPSEMVGNIYCLDQPDELVLGYISAGTQTVSERKFIQGGLMRRVIRPACNCVEDIGYVDTRDIAKSFVFRDLGWMPMWAEYPADNVVIVSWHLPRCGDCRLWGGTKDRPSWWPNAHMYYTRIETR